MALSKAEQIAATAAALLVILLAAALSPAEAAVNQKTCLQSIVSLTPCLPFVENKASAPSAACCQNFAHVLQVQPLCLCAILDGEAGRWLGIPIDVKRALALPPACSVQTPPISECNTSAHSVSAESPTPSAPAPSVGSPSGVHSGAGFTKSTLIPFLGLLFAVLYFAGF